jgi:hypothetical protein
VIPQGRLRGNGQAVSYWLLCISPTWKMLCCVRVKEFVASTAGCTKDQEQKRTTRTARIGQPFNIESAQIVLWPTIQINYAPSGVPRKIADYIALQVAYHLKRKQYEQMSLWSLTIWPFPLSQKEKRDYRAGDSTLCKLYNNEEPKKLFARAYEPWVSHNPSGSDTALEIAQELLPSLKIERAANVSPSGKWTPKQQSICHVYMVLLKQKLDMQVLILKD